jgi:hypothetical protein
MLLNLVELGKRLYYYRFNNIIRLRVTIDCLYHESEDHKCYEQIQLGLIFLFYLNR